MFTKLHAILEVIGTRSKIVAISDDSTKIDLKLAELQKENPQGEYVRQFDISSDIEEIELKEVHLVQAKVNDMILNLAAYEEEHHAFDAVQSLKAINSKFKYVDEAVPVLKSGELPKVIELPNMNIGVLDKDLYSTIIQVAENVFVFDIVGKINKQEYTKAHDMTLKAASEKAYTGNFKSSDAYTIDTIVLDSVQDITFYRVVHNDDFIGKSLQDFEVVNHLNVVFEKFSENNII